MDIDEALKEMARREVDSRLDDFIHTIEYTVDSSDFVSVDGEEGDYGITRYLHDGKCFLVNFNFAGDWEENIITPYGIDLVIRAIFNESFQLGIQIETIDGEDRKALRQYFGNTKADQKQSQLGDYMNSPHIDQECKDGITEYLNKLRNFGVE